MSALTRTETVTDLTPSRRRRLDPRTAVFSSLGVVAFVLVWALASTLVDSSTLASPLQVLTRFVELTVTPLAGSTLGGHSIASIGKWAGGFLIAAALGLPLGYAFGWWPSFRSAVLPAFEVLRYIPPFAWIPLTILWFGPGYAAQAAIVFIAVLPPVVLNAELGVRTVDQLVIRASRVLGASRTRTLVDTVIPASAPSSVAGLRIALGNGWMALMGAELIVGRSGLGYVILSGQQSNDSTTVIAGMVAIGLLGAAVDRLVVLAASPLTRWRKGLEEL
ncbi:ABC transporter permease [Aeromicrobium sp. CF4.19]|uniref:ABC transporter permease n=1 Tax=Aeromicrobium sp. CF4.19 TaxID=3373082 RepID=UPI003EE4CCF1